MPKEKKGTKAVYKIKCLSAGHQYESTGFYESVEEFLEENPALEGNRKKRWVRDLKSAKEISIDSTEEKSINRS